MRTSTRQTVAQSPKIWTNVDRLPKSPSGITETDEAELIFRTPEQGSRIVPPEEKNSGSGGKDTHPLPSQLDHISPAIITLSERQPPAATQLERSGGKGSTPPGTKGPPGGTPFSFERPVNACDLEKRAIFSGGGCSDSVGGKEEPDGKGRGIIGGIQPLLRTIRQHGRQQIGEIIRRRARLNRQQSIINTQCGGLLT